MQARDQIDLESHPEVDREAGESKLPIKIDVIGDVTLDWLIMEDPPSYSNGRSDTYEQDKMALHPVHLHGGAWLTRDYIHATLAASPLQLPKTDVQTLPRPLDAAVIRNEDLVDALGLDPEAGVFNGAPPFHWGKDVCLAIWLLGLKRGAPIDGRPGDEVFRVVDMRGYYNHPQNSLADRNHLTRRQANGHAKSDANLSRGAAEAERCDGRSHDSTSTRGATEEPPPKGVYPDPLVRLRPSSSQKAKERIPGTFFSRDRQHWQTPEFLVIEDLGLGFRNSDHVSDALAIMRDVAERPENSDVCGGSSQVPSIVLLLNRTWPWHPSGDVDGMPRLWSELLKEENAAIRKRTLVLLSGNLLRDAGAAEISRGRSWERTAREIEQALAGSLHETLGQFGHIAIRLGVAGALYAQAAESTSWPFRSVLFYDPACIDGEVGARQDEGSMCGNNSLLAASLLEALLARGNHFSADTVDQRIKAGMIAGLHRVRAHHDNGYGQNREKMETYFHNNNFPGGVFKLDSFTKSFKAPEQYYFSPWWSPTKNLEASTTQSSAWQGVQALKELSTVQLEKLLDGEMPGDVEVSVQDLKQVLRALPAMRMEPSHPFEKSRYCCLDLPAGNICLPEPWSILEMLATRHPGVFNHFVRNIVREGFDQACTKLKGELVSQAGATCMPPVGSFGKLKTLDRQEIEEFRNIGVLIRQYIRQYKKYPNSIERPLSFAVFGPPGSGKSFGVSELTEGMADKFNDVRIEIRKHNVAQWDEVKDLERALIDARDILMRGKIPVVFFDEFDSSFQNSPYGWLKFFLAPMEDGEFKLDSRMLKVACGIFVFAGGTADNFALFRKAANQQEGAKGVDFISRLSGQLNVRGLQSNDPATHVRRALSLRRRVEQSNLLDRDNVATVDDSVIDLLMQADYIHGNRSMRSILDIWTRYRGGRVSLSGAPAPAQQALHIRQDTAIDDSEAS